MHSCGCSPRHVASQEVPDLAAPTPAKSSLISFAFTSHISWYSFCRPGGIILSFPARQISSQKCGQCAGVVAIKIQQLLSNFRVNRSWSQWLQTALHDKLVQTIKRQFPNE